MSRRFLRGFASPPGLWTCLFAFLLVVACAPQRPLLGEEKDAAFEVTSLVVMGFYPYMSPGEQPDVVRNRISGAVFAAQPVEEEVLTKMTIKLVDSLSRDKAYDITPPGQAKGVFSSLVSSQPVLSDIEIMKRIGQAFSADAVLAGHVYRWVEREGTDYAVNRPASVAFDLYLLRTSDGAILWKGSFDKSQQSLSENLLDLETFVKGGGKWMTVEALAEMGLTGLLGKIPKGEHAKNE